MSNNTSVTFDQLLMHMIALFLLCIELREDVRKEKKLQNEKKNE